MSTTTKLALVSVLTGVAIASVALLAGFQHNPQGEFYDPETGAVKWAYSAMFFALWFGPVSIGVGILLAAIRFVLLAIRHQLRRSHR